MFCCLITVVILPRCSSESFAPAPACPVVVEDLLSAADLPSAADLESAFMFLSALPLESAALVLPLRPSVFMSLLALPVSLLSELKVFDFCPGAVSCARWFLPPLGCIFSSDWVDFIPEA